MTLLTQAGAEKILSDMGLRDMPIKSIHPMPHMVAHDWLQKYRRLAHDFMMSLSDSIETLAMLNLTQDEFMALIMGRALPGGMSLRLRVPLIWGGELKIDNMFMCTSLPVAMDLDRFVISQSGSDTIWLPNPAKKIYIPSMDVTGGDGGNATEDRLAQMAAQIAAGRGME